MRTRSDPNLVRLDRDLLVTIKRKLFSFKIQPAYSTMVGLVRLHLMRYVDQRNCC
ncbi:MAG: hypothetical protein IPI91_13740 [Flavobacteriales bacterium]|nr:hypothetical protein [Flavobacteriales bacterium]